MMERDYRAELKQIQDLIKLAKQSKMAFEFLENEVEIIPLANINEEPEFNQDDLSFHPNGKCGCITVGDDYIFGIRCSHLIWFEGNCEGFESFWKDKDSDLTKDHFSELFHSIMICGNHKGIYMQKLIVFHKR